MSSATSPTGSISGRNDPIVEREVGRILEAHRTMEGGGFPVRRPFPVPGISHVDPFLLIDEMGPVTWAPGAAIGAPEHPHRGFETVTYLLDGHMQHEDSAGNQGDLRPGDVQWMTAGRGVIHSELPHPEFKRRGGRTHGFQIWINLPSTHKMMPPRYQDIPSSSIPLATDEPNKATVRVVAGTCLGVEAVIDTVIPITYLDIELGPGGCLFQPISPESTVLLHVFEGSFQIGGRGDHVTDGQCAVLTEGSNIQLRSEDGGRMLLLAGMPTNEPVARYGPFVMNTRDEILQAIEDFRSGTLA